MRARLLLASTLFLACSGARASDAPTMLRAPAPDGFLRAEAPRAFSFPADHGAHPGFRTEWWYLTGNLREKGTGRRFGYQLTIFRSQFAPKAEARASKWATVQAYMGHFTVTDVDAGAFHSAERFGRGALGLAGASGGKVWVDDWSIEGGREFPAKLRASDGGFSIEFALENTRPLVLHGDRGLSRKGAESGSASYYYSATRLKTAGRLTVGDKAFEVEGLSWLDREWSTSALAPDQEGWDWFALRFDDGRDLMVYRLRKKNGETDAFSAGTLVDRGGRARPLAAKDIRLTPLETRVARSGASYPSAWRVELPKEGLSIEVRPLVPDQELGGAFTYWEGAVEAKGTASGEGYLEMVGYPKKGDR